MARVSEESGEIYRLLTQQMDAAKQDSIDKRAEVLPPAPVGEVVSEAMDLQSLSPNDTDPGAADSFAADAAVPENSEGIAFTSDYCPMIAYVIWKNGKKPLLIVDQMLRHLFSLGRL